MPLVDALQRSTIGDDGHMPIAIRNDPNQLRHFRVRCGAGDVGGTVPLRGWLAEELTTPWLNIGAIDGIARRINCDRRRRRKPQDSLRRFHQRA